MTEENYNYRTSPFLLRNQFGGDGQFKIPIIPKATLTDEAFKDLLLIGFDRTHLESNNHLERMVHFFLYDYKFERVWKHPDNDIEKLKRYKAVLSPDFSMYLEMSPALQLYNTFRNRWCGAYFASKGIPVIPTVSWGDENTYDFAFLGIPKGSTVAVSTYMVSAHGQHQDQKAFFIKGYREMLRQIEPERIICYHEPFPEMEGNIVFVDYGLSSWRYQNDDYKPSKYVDYILGRKPLPETAGIVIKSGYVMQDTFLEKGMGSVYGGEWRPSKEEDERLIGKPGEIKITYNKKGEKYETKIGENGGAVKERHHTNHNKSWVHTDPHDHIINWEYPNPGRPNFEKPHINYPDGAPEFKNFGGIKMSNIVKTNSDEENRFKTISDFKDCLSRNGEVEFNWKGKNYSITHTIDKICIGEGLKQETEKCYDTTNSVLEYLVDGDRLRDVITQVEVLYRSF